MLSRRSGGEGGGTASGVREVGGREKAVSGSDVGWTQLQQCLRDAVRCLLTTGLETVLGFGHLVIASAGHMQRPRTLVPWVI